MPRGAGLVLICIAAALGQDQQQREGRPGWPCVADRAVDPVYIELSEGTGGHLFLLQKGEMEHATPLLLASTTHPATIFRAVGSLWGTKEWEFPVDSTVTSLLVAVSTQCRQSISVRDPQGAEITPANAILSQELKTGKLVRVDAPASGAWRVRVTGQGLYVLLVLAATNLHLGGLPNPPDHFRLGALNSLPVHIEGTASVVGFSMIGAGGETLAAAVRAVETESGLQLEFTPPVERFRLMAEGEDALGRRFRRVHPVLFQALP
ncbi:MAG: hypothetical protein HY858_02835 [Candidatus Solibacter usitatus]|nr:hypothetical protein [Candidatus Solibacter usitatus]